MRAALRLVVALGLGLCLAAALAPAAHAQAAPLPPIPSWRILYRNLLVARYNPVGLQDEGAILARRRLFVHDSTALRDNFAGGGLTLASSPAFVRLGGLVEVQPLSILHVWAAYERVQWFGTTGHLQSFPAASQAHDDATLRERSALPEADARAPHATSGTTASAGATLQVKMGPIAARLLGKWLAIDLDLAQGHAFAYDPVFDILTPSGGLVRTLDADLLWQSEDRARTVGLRWSQVAASLDRTCPAALGAACDGTSFVQPTSTQRLGPLVAWRLWQRGGASTGTLIGLAQWWLQHPYRTGQVSSQAIPYVALGLHITGDIAAAAD